MKIIETNLPIVYFFIHMLLIYLFVFCLLAYLLLIRFVYLETNILSPELDPAAMNPAHNRLGCWNTIVTSLRIT